MQNSVDWHWSQHFYSTNTCSIHRFHTRNQDIELFSLTFKKYSSVFLSVTLLFPYCSKHLEMSVKGSFISLLISCKTCDSACHLNLLLCVLRGHRTLLQLCSSCTLSTSFFCEQCKNHHWAWADHYPVTKLSPACVSARTLCRSCWPSLFTRNAATFSLISTVECFLFSQ